MVAKNIRLPNIRRMFVPDPGHTIVDADLSGADAQVVAWEAGDERLKDAFRRGLKIHIVNARDMWPEKTKDLSDDELKKSPLYRQIKGGVHGTNYGASPLALMANLGWTKKEAEAFIERWFYLHPEIKEWHHRYQRYLEGTQCWNCDNLDVTLGKKCGNCGKSLGSKIKNRFGFTKTYFDRIEGNVLNEALAWTPQSTVAFCTELGWTAMAHGPEIEMLMGPGQYRKVDWSHCLVNPKSHQKWSNIVQFLIQVHDSIVFQIPSAYEEDIPEIVRDLHVKVPYQDPLVIPMGYGYSRNSWGDIV